MESRVRERERLRKCDFFLLSKYTKNDWKNSAENAESFRMSGGASGGQERQTEQIIENEAEVFVRRSVRSDRLIKKLC